MGLIDMLGARWVVTVVFSMVPNGLRSVKSRLIIITNPGRPNNDTRYDMDS